MNPPDRFHFSVMIILIVSLVITSLACMSSTAVHLSTPQTLQPSSTAVEPNPKSDTASQAYYTLTVGDEADADALSITFNGDNLGDLASNNDLELVDSIVDFSFPGTKISRLSRSDVGGKVLINVVEFHYSPDKDFTALIFRFATSGQGKGLGNIGISLAYGLNLSGNAIVQMSSAKPGSSLEGELTSGNGCAMAEDDAKSDLLKIEVKAPNYTGLLGAAETCASFKGFVLFNQLSDSNDPYFEMLESESTLGWQITKRDLKP